MTIMEDKESVISCCCSDDANNVVAVVVVVVGIASADGVVVVVVVTGMKPLASLNSSNNSNSCILVGTATCMFCFDYRGDESKAATEESSHGDDKIDKRLSLPSFADWIPLTSSAFVRTRRDTPTSRQVKAEGGIVLKVRF